MWLGRRWCELIGPEHFFLSYGASEGHGLACCRGDEWLAHPGTLGRPLMGTEVKILDQDGHELPTGEIGGIYMRSPLGAGVTYIGENVTQLAPTPDGFVTVGDMGWVDEEGWLYMADRRVDMIVTGAANVYPAEVESALSEHPQVRDVVVIGLRDPEWGRRVHAIIEPADVTRPPDPADIIAFAKERLSPYKVPKTVEFLDALPRSDAMKLNRGALGARARRARAGRRDSRPGGGLVAGPLEGTRVIDLGGFVVGPSTAAIMADWGADVVKVEPPDGDPNRAWTTDRNPAFELDNRGKRSVILDLKVPQGIGVLLELLATADVLVTNMRPRVLESMGLDYESVAERFPRLIYAAITGYGPVGPDRDRAAYDAGAFWSRAGVLATMTRDGDPLPYTPGGRGTT